MELVYLWVEEYKNIRNQGFNFSPRFECEFDGENLTINEKKDYVSIFPDNINVTAIVGENGSGKSSVLETLIYLIDSTTILKDKNNFLIVYDEKWRILTHSSLVYKFKINDIYEDFQKINRNIHSIDCLLSIFVNCITDLTHSMKYRQLGDFFENYKNGIQPKVKEYKFDDVEKENFVIKFLDLLVDENSFFNFLDKKLIFDSYYFFTPIKINIDVKENNQCQLLKELNSKTYEEKYNTELIFLLRIILSNIIELLRNEIINYTDAFIKILSNKYENIDLNKFDYQSYKEICETINNYLDSIKNEAYIKIHQKKVEFITKVSTFDKSYIDNLFEVWKFDKYEQDVYTETFEITKDIFNDKNELFKLLFEKNYIKIDFFRNKDVSYQQLSSGEKLYLKHFTNIAYSVKYFQKDKHAMYLMLLDEIELSFHPEWQKKIIFSIENIVKKLNKQNKEFHFILTSHSPFILSDIPKENVIFLDKFDNKTEEKYPKLDLKDLKNGNCINVSNHIEIKTFGANIHTLLSDGFFMNNGLMGEFAKGKINEIKKFYEIVKFLEPKNKKYKRILKILYLFKIKEFKHIQSIIGEPFLQTIIKNYLDEVEILFNGKKEFLDKEILRLQELRKELK